jgi:flagellar biosynthesis protein FlhF
MKLKSFFADSIEAAISLARREMGPDAMLMNSKRSNPEAKHLGAYEVVVCAADTEPLLVASPREARNPASEAARRVDRISQDISDLKHQMDRLALSLARSGSGMAGIASNPELSKALAALTDAELDADLAYEVIGRIGSPAAPGALRAELASLVKVDAELGCRGPTPSVVALVGPPGAGKTSSLVKLAVQYGITRRRPTQILSVDTYRIAAADELRSYAAILGIGCQVLETVAALAQTLEEQRQKDLILIDTPGLCRNAMEGYEDLAQFLSTHPGVDTHLVLPASMRTEDMKRMAERYAIFKPSKLLFTRIDETQTFGPILSQSVRMKTPVSFLCSGQGIPEDMQAATTGLILDLVLKVALAEESKFGMAAA